MASRFDQRIQEIRFQCRRTGKPFGEIAVGFDAAEFDDTTIAGAIETIIAYARNTFDCPVVFYTGSYCEKENYPEMVSARRTFYMLYSMS
jgi:hypothetical protein